MTKMDKARIEFEIKQYELNKGLGLVDKAYNEREIYLLKLLFRVYKSIKKEDKNDYCLCMRRALFAFVKGINGKRQKIQ